MHRYAETTYYKRMPCGDNFKGKPRPAGAGRAKGTPNKTTAGVREGLTRLWDKRGLVDIEKALEASAEEDRADIWAKVMPYFVPKLNSLSLTTDADALPSKIEVTILTPEIRPDED